MFRTAAFSTWVGGFLLFLPVLGQEPNLFDAKFLEPLAPRCIGPANMGGRIVDVAVVEKDPQVMYVATASGGLWKTVDNGDSWTPIFDHQATISLGDVTVAPSNPDIVWVGTGEGNARNSVSWGDGVYRSGNGGKTWVHMGLKESHHIGRIVIHPQNPNIVYVAALGHLWGPNKERGLFKTSDGGKTWDNIKFIDENTGFIDVAIDPVEPDILYAAAYCVRRGGFSGGNPVIQFGPGAGLYKTSDGGKTWEKMTIGLPNRPFGRCGLDIHRKNPNIVYAVVQTDQTKIVTVAGQAAGQGPRDAGGIFRSEDKGTTWTYVNALCPRPFYYGQIRVDPNDDARLYVLGIGFYVSNDGGRTFASGAKGVHPDHHALWINPKDSKHLVLGNDGGLYFSQTRGAAWQPIRGMAIGQFYAIGVDMRKPFRVYGGLQDNGSWGGPSATSNTAGITQADWFRILGADGFHCQVDPTDPNIVYAEAQYGRPARIDLRTKKAKSIQPQGPRKGAYRFNWSAPMLLSPHNPKRLYYAGNFVFRSDTRGDTWEVISPDLTRGKPGPSAHTGHTITALAESPLRPGLLWAGSDDGRLHVTRDGGKNWIDLSDKVMVGQDRWISRIEASHFAEGTAYLTIDRHRNDDRRPYVFKTTDYGTTWQPLAGNLPPEGSVHVLRESSRNKDLLFVGTEFGLFVSRNGGASWQRIKNGLPTVAVHDLVIHPRDRDLVIGTHGRSIYVMNIAPLEEMSAKVLAADMHLYNVRPAVAFTVNETDPPKGFVASNPPYGATIYFHLLKEPVQAPTLTITDPAGKKLAFLTGAQRAGLQAVTWNLRRQGDKATLVPAGEYGVRLHVGERDLAKKVRVEGGK